ncbi:DUF4625 domain-containing protein [Geofilum sp. OHC36d9]|uniref:DUF4625 domain-containing protein n=1 Tax=Geofilum sp. OHC36d9 TaxID=3458413 RepID=UPI004033DBBE
MKSLILPIAILLAVITALSSCSKDDVDDTKPIIDMTLESTFPQNCDTIYFGEPFIFNAGFSDNNELGTTNAFSLEIHNNFNHHAHSTEVTECELDPAKDPENPFTLIAEYDIPEGKNYYEPMEQITIPHGDENGLYDEGDYHFFISLADKNGWTVQKGLSIKIIRRP